MQGLPPAVAKSLRSELGNKQVKEVEKISYDGIMVLYEAEYYQDGEEHGVYAYPSVELAARYAHEQEHEQEEEGPY